MGTLGEASKAQKERLEAELKGAEAAKADVEKEHLGKTNS